jgi:hypothetical protein
MPVTASGAQRGSVGIEISGRAGQNRVSQSWSGQAKATRCNLGKFLGLVQIARRGTCRSNSRSGVAAVPGMDSSSTG